MPLFRKRAGDTGPKVQGICTTTQGKPEMKILKASLLLCSSLFACAAFANPPSGGNHNPGDRTVIEETHCTVEGCWTDKFHYIWTPSGWMLLYVELAPIPEDPRVK
jgi:hypothetical protein